MSVYIKHQYSTVFLIDNKLEIPNQLKGYFFFTGSRVGGGASKLSEYFNDQEFFA
jgi:hypothetical protein